KCLRFGPYAVLAESLLSQSSDYSFGHAEGCPDGDHSTGNRCPSPRRSWWQGGISMGPKGRAIPGCPAEPCFALRKTVRTGSAAETGRSRMEPTTRSVLSNGLVVLLREVHAAPVA